MNPDASWLYGYSEVTGVVAAPGSPLALPAPSIAGSWAGVWELLAVTVNRTLGAASVNYSPSIRDSVSADPTLNVYAGPLAINPALSSTFLMSGFAINPAPQAYVNPQVGGDTFKVRTLWRRRLPGPS